MHVRQDELSEKDHHERMGDLLVAISNCGGFAKMRAMWNATGGRLYKELATSCKRSSQAEEVTGKKIVTGTNMEDILTTSFRGSGNNSPIVPPSMRPLGGENHPHVEVVGSVEVVTAPVEGVIAPEGDNKLCDITFESQSERDSVLKFIVDGGGQTQSKRSTGGSRPVKGVWRDGRRVMDPSHVERSAEILQFATALLDQSSARDVQFKRVESDLEWETKRKESAKKLAKRRATALPLKPLSVSTEEEPKQQQGVRFIERSYSRDSDRRVEEIKRKLKQRKGTAFVKPQFSSSEVESDQSSARDVHFKQHRLRPTAKPTKVVSDTCDVCRLRNNDGKKIGTCYCQVR